MRQKKVRFFISKNENALRLGGLICGENADFRGYDIFTDEPLGERRTTCVYIGPNDLTWQDRRSKTARLDLYGAQATLAPRRDGRGFELTFANNAAGEKAYGLLLEDASKINVPAPEPVKKKRRGKKPEFTVVKT